MVRKKSILTMIVFTVILFACAGPDSANGQLLFNSDRDLDAHDLYLLDVVSLETTRLALDFEQRVAGPFSPDGKTFAFTGFGLAGSDIFLAAFDGSAITNLTNNETASNLFPAWSPDGTQIAFTAWPESSNDLFIINIDGTGLTRLTFDPLDELDADWSPDGKRLVYISDSGSNPGVYQLSIFDLQMKTALQITADLITHQSPAWSPNGEWIAFAGYTDGASDIYLIRPDGTDLKNLTNHPSEDWSPSWSPDGSRIAFETDRDGNWEIYVMDSDGRNPMNLTNNPAVDERPFWRP